MLGLWTAGWLAAFLVAGMLWLGEPSVQWPVLAVPLLWALLALRPRRRPAADDDRYDDEPDHWDDDRWDDDRWDDHDAAQAPWDAPAGPRPAERTDTVERPALRRPSEFDEWGRRRPG
jgi:hypothetical protein